MKKFKPNLLTPLNLQNTCGNTQLIISPGVFRPSLNKQVISYVSKLFPTGIT